MNSTTTGPKAKITGAKMAGKSEGKIARTVARQKAAAGKPTPRPSKDDLARVAVANLHHKLMTACPKLDKHGERLRKSLQMVIDGGDLPADLPALTAQVEKHITDGTPDVVKSTRRRKGAEPDPTAAALTAEDKSAITEEAAARGAGKIDYAKSSNDGHYLVFGITGGDSFPIKNLLVSPDLRDMSQPGKSFAKAKALAEKLIADAKGQGHLARGLDARNAPQSVAAQQAGRKGAKKPADPKPDLRAKAATAKVERKEERAAKAAPKAGDKRTITILKKDFAFGKDGTSRRASWDKCMKAKTVDAYIQAGGAAKYLPRWVSVGAIKLG